MSGGDPVDEWMAARFGKPKQKPPPVEAEQSGYTDTVQVLVDRSVPPKEVRKVVLGRDDEYLHYIRDTVGNNAKVDYVSKNILGKPEFVVSSGSQDALKTATELISDLLEGVKQDLENLNKEFLELPKGKNWADEDDEEFELPAATSSTPASARRSGGDSEQRKDTEAAEDEDDSHDPPQMTMQLVGTIGQAIPVPGIAGTAATG